MASAMRFSLQQICVALPQRRNRLVAHDLRSTGFGHFVAPTAKVEVVPVVAAQSTQLRLAHIAVEHLVALYGIVQHHRVIAVLTPGGEICFWRRKRNIPYEILQIGDVYVVVGEALVQSIAKTQLDAIANGFCNSKSDPMLGFCDRPHVT
jgi:hypothetical protein